VRICRVVAKLFVFGHPRCPGPNGAPAPTGPAGGLPPLPPLSDEAAVEAAPDDLEEDPLEEGAAAGVCEAPALAVGLVAADSPPRARVTRGRDRTT
jgi:hypothetical protein